MIAAVKPLLLAAGFVLLGSADWELVVPPLAGEPAICAKSRETCETARTAIGRGWWPIAPPDTPTECRPHPGCFEFESNFIAGFNLPGSRR